MPYGQPQDADQLFYSDFIVQWTFNGSSAVSSATVVAPPGVVVARTGTGLYTVTLPTVYTAALTSNGTPITSVAAFPTVNASTAAATDVVFFGRYVPANSTLSTGVFGFAFTSLTLAAPPVITSPADPTNLYTASVMLQLKYNSVLVNVS